MPVKKLAATMNRSEPTAASDFTTIDDAIAAETARAIVVAETALAVFNVGGRLFAIEDGCLFCGSSLASGVLCRNEVTCSRCAWKYDLTTGAVKGVPRLRADRYEVKVEDSRILISTKPAAHE
jgi:nitrite reductase/ring-hydroxylating ferredoxin subunit